MPSVISGMSPWPDPTTASGSPEAAAARTVAATSSALAAPTAIGGVCTCARSKTATSSA